MTQIKLSICIPTYNFGNFIGETLSSILGQVSQYVEIVVLDGGSTDNTQEVIQEFKNQYPEIHYIRFDKKGGIDKDLSLCVENARGEYCWLVSSDDIVETGAILRMLNEIESGHDVYLCNRLECDINLVPYRKRPWLSNGIEDRIFDFSNDTELASYLDGSQSLGALFSYMSSIVVNRNKWTRVGYNELFTGSNYAHVFRLFEILRTGGILKYIKDSLVKCRTGNDSFLDRGIIHRFLIDLKGYQLLADELFNANPVLKKQFMSVMQRQHAWYGLIRLRSENSKADLWGDLERRFLIFGYSKKKLSIIRILGSYRIVTFFLPVIKKIVNIKRKLIFDISGG
ncbi:MAG: glycosyltransferase family 2 protein [Nitrospirae bacterium]|nr:glycosyltransferase family 2 protein [Nitrospirota bacterium]MBI3593468.1 glycosyltransferase family 2 protein [Nitrospirota bacterium]